MKYALNTKKLWIPVLTILLAVVQYELKVVENPIALNVLNVIAIIINAINPLLKEQTDDQL